METMFRNKAMYYRDALLNDVVPFWENHSIDHQFGGYFNCLDRKGRVYDTDKFIWLQCRALWTFSMLYNQVDSRQSWLDAAKLGADFLKAHGMDADGNWYFLLTREGEPLVQPYNIFSDFFAVMGFAQYALAANDERAAELALKTYRNILNRKDNPKGPYNKAFPGTRPTKTLGFYLILSNLLTEMEHLLSTEEVKQMGMLCIDEIMSTFYNAEEGLIHENVNLDGSFSDTIPGRFLIPGHGIEGLWFILELAEKFGDSQTIEIAAQRILDILKFAWDEEYDGIFYFMDSGKKPIQSMEWDQKLWWVHQETLIALVMAYRLTQRQELYQWYEKVEAYALTHFPDKDYGEWFGYLSRRGEINLSFKGGTWKGFFHTPRVMFRCWKEFEKLAKEEAFAIKM